MRVLGFKINNYKSMGSEKNNLFVEPNVTALIGKNESGKSNILEAIGRLSFLSPLTAEYMRDSNRGGANEISIIIYLEFYQNELSRYDIDQCETKLSYIDDSTIVLEGGLTNLIKKDIELLNLIDDIIEYKSKNSVWAKNSVRKTINDYLDDLSKITTQIFINYKQKLKQLKSCINKSIEEKEVMIKKIDSIIRGLDNYYSLLPQIYYRPEDRQLESSYKYDKIKEIIEDKEQIITKFLTAAKISKEEILSAFDDTRPGMRQDLRNKINDKISKNIARQFNKFYTQDKISFQAGFDSRVLSFFIKTENNTMEFSERSNGLRWYISLFVDILSRDYEDKSVLYLLDEPGVHLHVNAQKELLKLFSDLAKRNNQIIYTTHSPYMINNCNILNVRAIDKDEDGITKIYRSAYDQGLENESKMETLSPLVKALGADLKFNIGPSRSDNIITEGITDYMYIKAIISYLGITNAPNIIPSTGASNINKIVSILIGWGCDFKILLDYDKAGYDEYDVLVNDLHKSLKDKIFFVNSKEGTDIVPKEIKGSSYTIESLISKNDFRKLSHNISDSYSSKTIVAKEFHDKIINKEFEPDEETILNFSNLFLTLGLISEESFVDETA
ncbi:ATP-dependent nuclease [Natronospora cellulosivora (SeqCode)]